MSPPTFGRQDETESSLQPNTTMKTNTITTPATTTITLDPSAPSLNKVMGYKNRAVVERLCKDFHLSAPQARELFYDMLRFLYLCRATNIRPISPPQLIDEAWHTFIIYTRDYAQFCDCYFGGFIHHRPNRPGEKHGTLGGRNCRMLAQFFFKDKLSNNWGMTNADCEACGNQCSKSKCSSKSCESSCREECCI